MNKKVKTISPSDISQPELHAYLLSAVAPRPICFASTVDKDGNVNLSPFSFFNVFSSNPPVLIFSPARSGRDGSMKHTHQNVLEVPEVVINIVNYPMVEQMSLSSTAYDKGVNEFEKTGFTQVKSDVVAPPRVGEAPVAMECTVTQVIPLADAPGAGNLILAKVERMHIQEEYLDADGQLDTQKLDLVGRMGGSWYTRSSGDSLFEIPKPVRNKGIGVDRLPTAVVNSAVLTGNNLGRLGNLENIPTAAEMEAIRTDDAVVMILSETNAAELVTKVHQLAQKWLEEGKTQEALALLFSYE
ncbi:flavin reductase family protein [Maribacter antarcticus]|uniref:flavin reductase family protein n=1 Tax=Maribacter antarcticus TaxID=505250 RepID=UPI00047CA8DE|nr:flavin reductase family protein [Maribacter antarcticus]